MARALGTTIILEEGQCPTRFERYLLLPDVLIAAADKSGKPELADLAKSFSNDVLNLAALAGRLLWYEGVSPDVWRSPDLITVSVDIEAYFVMLQTACDIMADAIATLSDLRKQKLHDSFHSLTNWIPKNQGRIPAEFHFVGGQLPWFDVINSVRTKLVHQGGDVWVFTNRVQFSWSVHGRKWKGIPRLTSDAYLLPELSALTHSVLCFSRRLAGSVCRFTGVKPSKKNFISGVFVPAIEHLSHYTAPQKSRGLTISGKCLVSLEDYATAAAFGYPDGFWWNFLLKLS